MSVLAITCDNCGAKYRLPETFQGDKAKCQKCGSVIDVAAQRTAASAPAPLAKPAPVAKPAAAPVTKTEPVAKKESGRPARESAKADEAPTRSRRSRDAAATGDDDAKPARGRKGKDEAAPKKSNTMMLAGGGIAALAIVAVIVVLSTNKKDAPKATEQAKVEATEKPAAKPETPKPTENATPAPKAETPPADSTKPVADANGNATKGEPTPAVAPAKDQEPKTPAGEAPKAEEPKTEEPKKETPAEASPAKTEPAADDGHKEKWEANKTASLADVFDAKTLGDVTWPAEIAADEQTEVRSLVEDVVNGGRAGIQAKPKIEKHGFAAIFGLAEKLRQLDYKSSDDQMTAWELNKILESILVTLNAGFVAVEAGSDLDPRKADHNARTNQAWARLLTRWASREEFNTWRKEKLAEKSKK